MTVPEEGTDVVIAGAGPTGLTLANLLGRMGIGVALVERNATTVREPRAVSIDDESMRTMQAAGLAREVGAIVARGYGSRYYGPDGACFAVVDPISTEYGFDKRNGFQQPELEDVLRRGLDRFPTVQPLFRHELAGFSQSPESVRVRIRGPEGQERSIAARYLVGADGARSLVRKTLGIPLEGDSFSERWLIVDLADTANRLRHTEVFCNPRRPCITLPGPNGIRRYEFMLHEGEGDETATDEAFVRRLLAAVGPDGGAAFRRVRVYTFHARMARRWRDGRVFLAGDAAHLTPPFAGQGMNSGLRDAHNLAWKLAEAVRCDAPDDRLLDSYETERKPHAGAMIRLALRMGRIMTPTSSVQALLTRRVFRLLGVWPPARDYVAQMRYKPKPRFAAGLLWPDGRDPRSTMVGRLFPQPVVETPDRDRVLLDELLPDRPVVLVFADQPDRAVTPAAQAALEAAGAALVGLTPEGINPIAGGFPVVRDAGRQLAARPLADYLGHAFLLRRDRYVAAVRPVARLDELAALLPVLSPAAGLDLAGPVLHGGRSVDAAAR